MHTALSQHSHYHCWHNAVLIFTITALCTSVSDRCRNPSVFKNKYIDSCSYTNSHTRTYSYSYTYAHTHTLNISYTCIYTYSYRNTYTYTCTYPLVNKPTTSMRCPWSNNPFANFSSVALYCNQPAAPPNAYQTYPLGTGPKYRVGTFVYFSCQPGFYIVGGNAVLQCTVKGWLKDDFRCISEYLAQANLVNPFFPANVFLKAGAPVNCTVFLRWSCLLSKPVNGV